MVYNVFEKIALSLKEDPDIIKFCTQTYSKALKIYIGQNIEAPIEKDSCPCVILSHIFSLQQTDQFIDLKVIIGIYINDEIIDTNDTIIKYIGFEHIEYLGELVRSCLLRLPYKSYIDGYSFPMNIFPTWAVNLEISIELPLKLRGVMK